MRAQAQNRSNADRSGERPTPRPVTATASPPLIALQRAAGNAAVTRAIQRARDEHQPEGERGGAGGRDGDGPVPVQRRQSVVDAVGSPGRPLEGRILQRAEQAYGMDFGHVRVHSGPVAQRSAEALGALAYTTGSHIVLGGNRVSDEVMYEEVDHVRQQALGPVPGADNGRGERVGKRNGPGS
ncbi:eCIS core domain-containing protein [Streptomyces massasporeus]|uniref:eCIS core domain-containing protein n=1 Tax=Streptomyces massasporeus TaxID=67324 RepID=UPI0033E6C95E